MSDSVICPDCKGEGSFMALVRYGGDRGCEEQRMPCNRCHGNGEVPTEMLDWIEKGEEMRHDRLSRGLGQGEEARRLGVSPVVLSQVEFGKIDPSWLARRVETVAEAEADREAVRRGAAPIHQGHGGAPCVCAFPDHKREPK